MMGHRDKSGNRSWNKLRLLLDDASFFVFSTHQEPDPDGLGSQLALARYLRQKGKTVHILNPTPVRNNLEYLYSAGEVEVYNRQMHQDILSGMDVFIAFDIGSYDRLGSLGDDIAHVKSVKISIDHHPGDKYRFDIYFDDASASSTGIMIFDLLKQIADGSIKQFDIAEPLYTAMMSDTGNFRFNNTDKETFLAAAELVEAGVKPYEAYVHIYENLNTVGRLIVLKHLLKNINYALDGAIAWSSLDYMEMHREGVDQDDLHGLSDFIRSIKGVEIGCVLILIDDNTVDVSIRSKGHVAINGVARQFGGGGHAFAAGCSIQAPLEEASKALIKACTSALEQVDADG